MVSLARNEIVPKTELARVGTQLTYIVKSLRFLEDVCYVASEKNSDPIQRLEICALILRDKIDDLNSIVKRLNHQAKKRSPTSNKAA